MSRNRIVAWTGLAAFALSWFLPVLGEPPDLNGWAAFRAALPGLWHPDSAFGIYAGCSALTSVLMVIALGATARGIEVGPRWAWSLMLAGFLNAWWLVVFRANLDEFRIGYFVWWLSFFAVGWALLPGRTSVLPASGGSPASGS